MTSSTTGQCPRRGCGGWMVKGLYETRCILCGRAQLAPSALPLVPEDQLRVYSSAVSRSPRRGDSARILTEPEVREIRSFTDEGWTGIRGNGSAIALAYGISRSYIAELGRRSARSWVSET